MEKNRPELENLSQGARLKYIRELRYLKKDYVADYFELGFYNLMCMMVFRYYNSKYSLQ